MKSDKDKEHKQDVKVDMFKAELIDAEKKAQNKEATVQVSVKGIKLVDPASVNNQPKEGQGHLHYQVDDGPIIATTTPKQLHGLLSGPHKIVVMLAANDHRRLAHSKRLPSQYRSIGKERTANNANLHDCFMKIRVIRGSLFWLLFQTVQVAVCRPLKDPPVGIETRAVTRAVPCLFRRIPSYYAAQMCADG